MCLGDMAVLRRLSLHATSLGRLAADAGRGQEGYEEHGPGRQGRKALENGYELMSIHVLTSETCKIQDRYIDQL